MKRKALSKKSKRSNIPFKRKIAILYYRLKLLIKIFVIFFFYLLFFTRYLNFVKEEVFHYSCEIAADVGFKLENVLIEGQKNTSAEEIISTLNADTGTPIFAIDLKNVKKQLERNPWIKEAVVERRMPSTIYITLLEREAIAIWQINQKLYLIDEEGSKITTKNIDKFENLPHVVGIDANLYAKKLIDDISKFPRLYNKMISAVRYGERRWNLNLQQNITVKMPETDFENALNYLLDLDKEDNLFNQNYKIIDLRDQTKYYIEKFPS